MYPPPTRPIVYRPRHSGAALEDQGGCISLGAGLRGATRQRVGLPLTIFDQTLLLSSSSSEYPLPPRAVGCPLIGRVRRPRLTGGGGRGGVLFTIHIAEEDRPRRWRAHRHIIALLVLSPCRPRKPASNSTKSRYMSSCRTSTKRNGTHCSKFGVWPGTKIP